MNYLTRLITVAILLTAMPVLAQEEKKQETGSAKAKQEGAKAKQEKQKPVKTRIVKAASRNPGVKPLNLKVPVTWKDVKSRTNMRAASLAIPAAKGDKEKGELAVFIFGPQSLNQNVDRWIGQFRSEGRKKKVVQGKRSDSENKAYYLVELSGTYKKPDGPPFLQKTKDAPGYRMLGALIPAKNALYVLKLTGPDKTVAAQAKAFRIAIGGDAKTEKPLNKE